MKDATDHEIQVMRARYTLLQEFGPLHERDRHPDDTKEAWFILDGHRIGWDIRRKTFEVILESEQ